MAIKAKADSARQNENDEDEDDIDNFSDINSQDESLVRERKEKNGLRKGMKSMASALISKAGTMIQTPVSALTALGRTNTTPFGDEELTSPIEVREETTTLPSGSAVALTKAGDDKMSDDE